MVVYVWSSEKNEIVTVKIKPVVFIIKKFKKKNK